MTFGLDLPMTEITPVKGQAAHPFYHWLAEEHGFEPGWNFNKVLIGPDGEVLGTGGRRSAPSAREITGRIERASAGMTPRFIGSEIYRHSSYGGWHPLRIPRVSTVMDLARALGWFRRRAVREEPAREAGGADRRGTRPSTSRRSRRPRRRGRCRRRCGRGIGLGHGVESGVCRDVPAARDVGRGRRSWRARCCGTGAWCIRPPGGRIMRCRTGRAGSATSTIRCSRSCRLRRMGCGGWPMSISTRIIPTGWSMPSRGDPDVLMLSVHEERRWPFTGALKERGAGEVWNLPVPRGFQRQRDAGGAGGADPAAAGGVPAGGGGAPVRGGCAWRRTRCRGWRCRTTRIGRWWRR